MASPFLQCRAGGGLRERAEKAASETDLDLGTWLRTVIELACIAHEDVELIESASEPGTYHEVRRTQGTCDCKGFVNAGHCWHLEAPRPADPGDIAETYVSDVEVAAAELRAIPRTPTPKVEHPPEAITRGRAESPPASSEEAKEEPLPPRECPHLPAWRSAGGRCRCGTLVGRGVRMRR